MYTLASPGNGPMSMGSGVMSTDELLASTGNGLMFTDDRLMSTDNGLM